MIIDTHTHVFPETLAYETVSKMAKHAGVSLSSNGTIAGLIESMDKSGVSLSITAPVATKASQVESINNFSLENRNERIINLAAIHPEYEEPYDELKKCKDNGFKGVKLHPDYQLFYPTDKRIFSILEACVGLSLPVLFHSGDDIGALQPGHALPRLFEKMLNNFPRLKVIFAHMGGWQMWGQVQKFLAGKDVYFDTSMVLGYINEDTFYSLVKKHGSSRILFGTDSPWASQEEYVSFIKESKLSDKEKEEIFSKNAKELFDIN